MGRLLQQPHNQGGSLHLGSGSRNRSEAFLGGTIDGMWLLEDSD